MRAEKILRNLYCQTWLLGEEFHKQLCTVITQNINAKDLNIFGMKMEVPEIIPDIRDGVAVININGVMSKGLSHLEKAFGMVDVDEISDALDYVGESAEAEAVLLAFDSPGGSVTGIPELADKVAALNAKKPVVAYTDSMMASAAYWVGSQAYAIYAAPSANIGSIGVYIPYLDATRMMEMQGLKVDLFTSGKYKGAGVGNTALTDDQKKMVQDRVNYLFSEFKAAVTEKRDIEDEDMQGQTFFGTQAKANGLIDDLSDLNGALKDARMLVR